MIVLATAVVAMVYLRKINHLRLRMKLFAIRAIAAFRSRKRN